MNRKISIKIKAGFLLLAFGLNTVIGFACSIGIDMGFNTKHSHHDDDMESVVHKHDNGKKHIHYENKHDHSKSHHHDKEASEKSTHKKDNCCNDKVLQVEQWDKSLPTSPNIVHPVFLIAFNNAFYNETLPATSIVKNIKQFVRSYHPPIPDIRIAIQSFQI